MKTAESKAGKGENPRPEDLKK